LTCHVNWRCRRLLVGQDERLGVPGVVLFVDKLGEPPVQQDRLAEVPEHDVLALQVAVDSWNERVVVPFGSGVVRRIV
tara:strand:- start:231 stop:464 length:234 start_codon:yes stop_codon:yes gene_type:complete